MTASPNSQRHTYSYDGIGTRRSLDASGAGRFRYTFQYDLTGNQRIEQPPTGNRTTTTWNYENQPTQYRLPTGSPVTMAYNPDNHRVSLQQGATTTKFAWDSVIDVYVKELDGSTSHVLHDNAPGTTRLLTTTAGASSDMYLCDARGNLTTSSGTTVNPFRRVGQYGYYMDQSTGIVYVPARMYLPVGAGVDPVLLFSLRTSLVYLTIHPRIHYRKADYKRVSRRAKRATRADQDTGRLTRFAVNFREVGGAR